MDEASGSKVFTVRLRNGDTIRIQGDRLRRPGWFDDTYEVVRYTFSTGGGIPHNEVVAAWPESQLVSIAEEDQGHEG